MGSVLCPPNSEEVPAGVPCFCAPNNEELLEPPAGSEEGPCEAVPVSGAPNIDLGGVEPKLVPDELKSDKEPAVFPVFDAPSVEELLELFPVLGELAGPLVAKSPLPERFCLLAPDGDNVVAAGWLNKPPGFREVVSFPCEVLPSNGIVVWVSLVDGVGDLDAVEDGVSTEGSDEGGIGLADVSVLPFPGMAD